ncbi:hypothetical protein [Streptomyces phage Verabelle]|uniref:Uncharacterized protein n=1 Tax=Streptomyces phage Verabelle TaxID=3065247 RepID=A0AA50F1A9_9CAUD|nr:hypothetical protein [Streptomyces phage Verabelle]
MALDPALLAATTGVMSGGFIGAIGTIWSARKKVPAERDSIIVSGAETAVLALEKTLEAETRRADRAEAVVAQRDEALARKDERISALESRLDALQSALDAARDELHAILTAPTD